MNSNGSYRRGNSSSPKMRKRNGSAENSFKVLKARGYDVKETIGVGGYSKVKLALNMSTQEKVAIKIITKKDAPPGFLTKFLPREVQALSKIHHPHITNIHEMIETSHFIFIVMQYAAGGDLLDFINKRGALSEDHARKLFHQIMSAVEHCHVNNVYHRDLKCENILLDDKGNILVTDFGFATITTGIDEGLKTHCGSYAYAAPEILRGQTYNGGKSDIWSLGVVLYAMTCGHLPYNDSNIRLLLAAICKPLDFSRVLSNNLQTFLRSILDPDVRTRATFHRLFTHDWMHSYASKHIIAPHSRSAHQAANLMLKMQSVAFCTEQPMKQHKHQHQQQQQHSPAVWSDEQQQHRSQQMQQQQQRSQPQRASILKLPAVVGRPVQQTAQQHGQRREDEFVFPPHPHLHRTPSAIELSTSELQLFDSCEQPQHHNPFYSTSSSSQPSRKKASWSWKRPYSVFKKAPKQGHQQHGYNQ
eukprot:m.82848 g.82848  ORF g.82848 m.82848 type:complete len:473 (-) comp12104_c0_seq1:288-1706(-)